MSEPVPTGAYLELTIPFKAWSLNMERTKHWSWRAEQASTVKNWVAGDCMQFTRKTRESWPWAMVAITVGSWYSQRRRRDPGNDYPAAKAAIDGLVEAGVIEDDSDIQVRRLVFVGSEVRPGLPGFRLLVEELEVPDEPEPDTG